MKPANFQLNFGEIRTNSGEEVKIEFLPCQFQKNVDECNKDVYFDPIVKPVLVDGLDCK